MLAAGRRPARALHEVARAAGRSASATSWSTSTRTRTTPSSGCSPCSPREHRNICVVGDGDQSMYAFRGADIRNILEFEHDFPDAARRSCSSRTTARRRRSWTPRTPSSPTTRAAGEDALVGSRARAAGRASSRPRTSTPRPIRRRRDREAARRGRRAGATSPSSTGRTPSAACWRTCSSARASPYRVVGGPRFYERAEIKDAIAYLQVIVNPADEVSLRRIVNQPRRGIGDGVARAPAPRTPPRCDARCSRRSTTPARPAGHGRRRPVARVRRAARRAARGRRDGVAGELLEQVLERDRLPGDARGGAHVRVAGPDGEPAGARGRRPRVRRARGGGRVAGDVPAGDLALLRLRHPRRGAARGHADDDPQREGARVPDRVCDRPRGGAVPAPALARRGRRGRGAAALLRRR